MYVGISVFVYSVKTWGGSGLSGLSGLRLPTHLHICMYICTYVHTDAGIRGSRGRRRPAHTTQPAKCQIKVL
jgi:hypothetical protein